MKYFRMSYEEVVYSRSFINIILLNRSIPSYKLDDDKGGGRGKHPGIGSGKTKRVPRPKSQHPSDFFMQFM